MASGSLERNIVRILFILYEFGNRPFQTDMFAAEQHARCVESELKIQKVDFWLRYPDHLSAALLRMSALGEPLEDRAEEVKTVIRRIFADEEPDVRWTPMLRFRHGAYERLDDVMCFLDSRRLAERRPKGRGGPTQYFLMPAGLRLVENLLVECSESRWYAERCRLLNDYLGDMLGDEQRDLQYAEESYGTTRWMQPIPRIDDLVRARFEARFGEAL